MGLAVGPGKVCSAGSWPLPRWYAARLAAVPPGESVRGLAIKCSLQEWPGDGL